MKYKTKESAIRQLNRGISFGARSFDNFRSNEEVALYAIKKTSRNFQYVDDVLKDNKEFLLKSIEETNDPYLLIFSSSRLRADKLLVKQVKNIGFAYKYLSQDLKNDKEIALLAVESRGFALGDMPKHLRNDDDVVKVAINKFPPSYIFASMRLRKNRQYLELAIKTDFNFEQIYKVMPSILKRDRNICLLATRINGQNLLSYEEYWGDDKEILLASIQSKKPFAWTLKLANEQLKNDKEFVLKFLKHSDRVIFHASEEIKEACKGNNPVDFLEKTIQAEKHFQELEQVMGKKNDYKTKIKI